MMSNFKEELKSDLRRIKEMLKLCESNSALAIELTVGGVYNYTIERNKNVICMLKKERKTLKRKLRRIGKDHSHSV